MDYRELKNSAFKQRERVEVSTQSLIDRVNNSPFGEKTKALLMDCVKYESYGGMNWALFNSAPVAERAEGSYVYDADGKPYIDYLSGFSVSQFGNCQKDITKIIQNQAEKLTHYFDLPHVERVKLSKKLCENSKITSAPTKVVYGVTGSDCIELAVRAARYYTGKQNILVAYGDYHGVTYGTMGLTSKGGMQQNFYPVAPDQHVGYFYMPHAYREGDPDGHGMEALRVLEHSLEGKETPYSDFRANVNNVAAILVEPFQSSAGYYIPPKAYLQELRRICDRFGILLIVDEIQAGLGRSGKLWAFEHSGIEPDMICTSKALGGGLSISAVIAKEEILMAWPPGAHVSTQAGNVLACAAGNYVLDVVSSPEFLAQVNEIGGHFKAGWLKLQEKHPSIGWVDNMGLYTGIELVMNRITKEPAADLATYVLNESIANGILFEKGGYYYNRLQLIPALNISKDVMDESFERLDKIFTAGEALFNIK